MTVSSTCSPESDSPEISVVIPTCNRAGDIMRCLGSLAVQTHRSFEIIVVDDCSTDDTTEQLDQFSRKHPSLEFTWLRNDFHAGANPSRNLGTRTARGNIIAFTDSDCIAEPEWLKIIAASFNSDRIGAVAGGVDYPDPTNIYEMMYFGTDRVPAKIISKQARRLVGCNMAVRRDLLLRFMWDEDRAQTALRKDGSPDVTVSGRGDEEGLYLMLRAAGYEIQLADDARVLHKHHYDRRSFFRQAYRGGASTARLVYKYRLPPRLDLLPFIMAWMMLPVGLLSVWYFLIPVILFCTAIIAVSYNEILRKGKTFAQLIRLFLVLLAYYHVRMSGYVLQTARLVFGRDWIQRVDLRRFTDEVCNESNTDE